MPKQKHKSSGFTLIELLIAIAIVSIIAVGAFVALDPLTRFRDARDATRWNDVVAILDAAKVDQVDNGGSYLAAISALTADNIVMIGTAGAGCDTFTCADVTVDDAACVDLTALGTEGYLASVPVAPTGEQAYTAANTGYYITRTATGALSVGACESENTASISVQK